MSKTLIITIASLLWIIGMLMIKLFVPAISWFLVLLPAIIFVILVSILAIFLLFLIIFSVIFSLIFKDIDYGLWEE